MRDSARHKSTCGRLRAENRQHTDSKAGEPNFSGGNQFSVRSGCTNSYSSSPPRRSSNESFAFVFLVPRLKESRSEMPEIEESVRERAMDDLAD